MIDFGKLKEDFLNSLSPEERAERLEFDRLTVENIFYTTKTQSVGENGEPKHIREVEVYRRVEYPNKVSDTITIDFEGYATYHFDKRFINHISSRLKANPDRHFSIINGEGIHVHRDEFNRIVNEATAKLTELGIEIPEDSNPSFTNSEMGKFIQSLGLM